MEDFELVDFIKGAGAYLLPWRISHYAAGCLIRTPPFQCIRIAERLKALAIDARSLRIWDDFESGSKAALRSGTETLVDYLEL
jgi:hypothetical protein